jgi:prolyl-tRNA synthetase
MEAPAFVSAVRELLGQVQESLLASATAFRDENIVDVSSYDELKAAVAAGGVQAAALALTPCLMFVGPCDC